MHSLILEILLFLCSDGAGYEMVVPTDGADVRQYAVQFSPEAQAQGFTDVALSPMTDSAVVTIPAPVLPEGALYPRPDRYGVQIGLYDGAGQQIRQLDTTFVVGYPNWITEQRFGDMIMLLSSAYNGGYTFSSYQWYCNDLPLAGQTEPYLYLPQGLTVSQDVCYSVGLVREGENSEIRTCPLYIEKDKYDRPAPTYNYLSVVPSVVDRTHPEAYILCRYEGSYRIYTSSGTLMTYGYFTPGAKNAYRILLPSTPGVYVVAMDAPTADAERHRSVRVVVR